MQIRYMLDTNTASYVIKANVPAVYKRLMATPMEQVCISVITEAELLFGLAKRPDALGLQKAVNEFLLRVDSLPLDSVAARQYGDLRAWLEGSGKEIGNMDLIIAAHALAVDAVLVSNDKAFRAMKHLKLEDWTRAR